MNTILILLAIGCPKCGHYGAACTYAAPAYVAPTFEYHPDPKYPGYYLRGYKTAAGGYYTETGHWVKKNGTWVRYEVPQIGSTVYGGSRTQYDLAVELGYKAGIYIKPGVLKQLGDAPPLNAKDFLPDLQRQRDIDVEGAKKAFAMVAEQQGQTDRAAIEAQSKERLAQIEASRMVALLQADERDQRLRHERLAILARAASVSSSGDTGADLPIADQQVRQVVTRNCFACHGGEQGVKGGVDFRLPLTPAQEDECKDQIQTGLMPKDGAMSLEDQNTLVGYFKGRVRAALGK